MDDVFNRILQIEKRARDMLADAKNQEMNIGDEIKLKQHEISETYMEKAKNRLAKVNESEQAYKNEAIDSIISLQEKQLESMNKSFIQNRDKWVDALYSNIINE